MAKPLLKMMIGAAAVLGVCAAGVSAGDIEISWWTVDGGGAMDIAGGTLRLSGTAGQPDASNALAGGTVAVWGGFWPGSLAGGAACDADCDGNNLVNSADVGCFLTLYFADLTNGTTVSDCDGNGVITSADVGCFLTLYFASVGPCP